MNAGAAGQPSRSRRSQRRAWPGVSPTDIARLHGISTGQLYTWRHALRAAQPDAAFGRFARVEVAPQPVAPVDIPALRLGLIEVALSDGTTVRVDAGIESAQGGPSGFSDCPLGADRSGASWGKGRGMPPGPPARPYRPMTSAPTDVPVEVIHGRPPSVALAIWDGQLQAWIFDLLAVSRHPPRPTVSVTPRR